MLDFQYNIPQATKLIAEVTPSTVQFKARQARVEAIRWQKGTLVKPTDVARPGWISEGLNSDPGKPGSIIRYGMDVYVYDRNGLLTIAGDGDWLVKDESGDLLVLPDELFRQFFEPVQVVGDGEPIKIDWDEWEKAHGR